MFEELLQDYIDDLKVQGVILHLQVTNFKENKQINPILNSINLEEINTEELMPSFRKELKVLQDVKTIEELKALTKEWFLKNINIQYNELEYSYGVSRINKITTLYCYVLFLRCLRKRHKKLWKMIREFKN